MTNAEIYLRAAERIDSGECEFLGEAFGATGEECHRRLLDNINPGDKGEFWTRETRVIGLMLMAAMERAK